MNEIEIKNLINNYIDILNGKNFQEDDNSKKKISELKEINQIIHLMKKMIKLLMKKKGI